MKPFEKITPERRAVLGFIANLFLLIVMASATIGFFLWRKDKPLDNPGGPLRGMGGWVLLWEGIATFLGPMLSVLAFFNMLRFAGAQFKKRFGEPPPVKGEQVEEV